MLRLPVRRLVASAVAAVAAIGGSSCAARGISEPAPVLSATVTTDSAVYTLRHIPGAYDVGIAVTLTNHSNVSLYVPRGCYGVGPAKSIERPPGDSGRTFPFDLCAGNAPPGEPFAIQPGASMRWTANLVSTESGAMSEKTGRFRLVLSVQRLRDPFTIPHGQLPAAFRTSNTFTILPPDALDRDVAGIARP